MLLLLAVTTPSNARSVKTLHQIQKEYTKEADDIKGSVLSVVTKSVTPVTSFGEIVNIEEVTTDSIVYDDKGRYSYVKSGNANTRYIFNNDTVIIKSREQNSPLQIHTSVTEYDSLYRIISVTKSLQEYAENIIESRQIFKYNAKGYSGEYYYESNKKITFAKEGNEFATNDKGMVNVFTFNKANRLEKKVVIAPLLGEFTTYFKYDTHGNLIAKGEKGILGNNLASKVEVGKDEQKWTYTYDEQGNWIEKYTCDKHGNKSTSYTKRVITYMSPEEIIAHQDAERERIKIIEDSLQNKGRALSDSIVEHHKIHFMECLMGYADNFIPNRNKEDHDTLRSFRTDGETYSFVFSDGESIDNVTFPYRHNGTDLMNGIGNLLSSDLRVVLLLQGSTEGPKWYVIKYGDIAKYNFNPNDKTDWVKLYNEKFEGREDVTQLETEQLWEQEIQNQWANSPEASIQKNCYYLPKDSVCANLISHPYENGWISPRLADKKYEKKQLEVYEEFKDRERRKSLCSLALNRCEFNEKSKPMADKVKHISTTDGKVTVKTKKGSLLSITDFSALYSIRHTQDVVLLSSNCDVALVAKTVRPPQKTTRFNIVTPFNADNYEPKTYIFIVQFEKDMPIDVSYASLKDFKEWEQLVLEGNFKYRF